MDAEGKRSQICGCCVARAMHIRGTPTTKKHGPRLRRSPNYRGAWAPGDLLEEGLRLSGGNRRKHGELVGWTR